MEDCQRFGHLYHFTDSGIVEAKSTVALRHKVTVQKPSTHPINWLPHLMNSVKRRMTNDLEALYPGRTSHFRICIQDAGTSSIFTRIRLYDQDFKAEMAKLITTTELHDLTFSDTFYVRIIGNLAPKN